MTELRVSTRKRCEMTDITREVQRLVTESGAESGLCVVFVPHTTAGVAINENADPDVKHDILYALERAVPNTGFDHIEGNSDAHTKAVMTGSSVNVIIENSRLLLGTWQSIYFCEFDGPREREAFINIIKAEG